MGLRWRLVGTYVLLVALAGLMSAYIVGHTWRSLNLRERELAHVTQASMASSLLAPHLGDADARDDILSQLARPAGVRILVTDPLGRVISDSSGDSALVGDALRRDEVVRALSGERGVSVGRLEGGGRAMYVAVPVYRDKRVVGSVFLAADVGDVWTVGRALERWLLATTAGGCLLAAIVGLLLSRAVTRPVERLSTAAGRLAAGDFSCRVAEQSMPEMRQLGHAFNHMAAALEEGDATRRLFAAGAAHELKSPLASMKAMIESLLSRPGHAEAVYRDFLSDIDREVDRLTHLSESLLVLARLEQGRAVLRRQVIPARELIEQAARSVAPRATAAGIELSVSSTSVEAWVDGDLVEIALTNLLDNAVKYSPEGSTVSVWAGIVDGGLEFCVRDQGPGVERAELDRIFDRFYRPDHARARDTGGTGLGLALVREVIHLHGGEIRAESGAGRGLTVVMRYPGGT